jgi:type I restriction enzyme S subunit
VNLFVNLPEHWEISRIDRVATINARIGWKALTAAEYQDAGYAFLATPNIKHAEIDFENVNYISEFRYLESPELQLIKGDVLLTKDGFTLGTVNVVKDLPRPATVNGSIAVIRPFAIQSDFLRYVIASSVTQAHIQAVKDGMDVLHLFQRDIKKLPTPLPPVEEQRRIATFLDAEMGRINKLCGARRAQVDLLQSRLDATWSLVIATQGEKYGWVPIRRFIQEITDGPFGSSLTSNHYSDAGARVIRLGNIGRAKFRNHDSAFIDLEHFRGLRRHEARAGDLIVAGLGDESQPLGRACILPGDIGTAMVKADCFRLRLNEKRVRHEYAAWALSSGAVAEQIAVRARGATRARINLNVVREIQIPTPSLGVQDATVADLQSRRDEIFFISNKCERQLSLLATRRQALITAAVTGQIDVSTASGRGIED